MSPFIPILRRAFLYLSQQRRLRGWVETSPSAHRLTSRFIAGLRLPDALAVVRNLESKTATATLDYLGENVSSLTDANDQREAYLQALEVTAAEGLPATIAVKVTALGLDISEDACRANLAALARRASETRNRVEMDMESSVYTDANLRLVRAMHDSYGSVRAVIQAYLHRSAGDIDDLCKRGVPVRLCKGAYREPPLIAYATKAEVDANYVKLMKTLLDGGVYPAIATHDAAIVDEAIAHVRRHSYGTERFEFQMLYGVRRALQERILREGFRLRVYVPYGAAWYPYFMRRLAERPANAVLVLRSLFT